MSENMKGGNDFEHVDIHGRIIVKLTLNRWCVCVCVCVYVDYI